MPPIRPLIVLAVVLALSAKSALATTPVEVARAQDQAITSWSVDVEQPESTVAIATTLGVVPDLIASREASVQIQLRTPDPASRDRLGFDRQYQLDPQDR
jgi:hypothetical protein